MGFPGGSDGKESACSIGDLGSIPGLGRSSGEGNSYPLQYSFLELGSSPGEGYGYPVQYSCLKIPWTEDPDGQSPWGHKELDKTVQLTLKTVFPLNNQLIPTTLLS